MSASRSKAVTPIRSVLSGVLQGLQRHPRPSQEEMDGAWKRIIGEEGARHSWPRRLSGRRLVVEVDNSGWMHALALRRGQILEGLVELLGAARVKDVGFRIGGRVMDKVESGDA